MLIPSDFMDTYFRLSLITVIIHGGGRCVVVVVVGCVQLNVLAPQACYKLTWDAKILINFFDRAHFVLFEMSNRPIRSQRT